MKINLNKKLKELADEELFQQLCAEGKSDSKNVKDRAAKQTANFFKEINRVENTNGYQQAQFLLAANSKESSYESHIDKRVKVILFSENDEIFIKITQIGVTSGNWQFKFESDSSSIHNSSKQLSFFECYKDGTKRWQNIGSEKQVEGINFDAQNPLAYNYKLVGIESEFINRINIYYKEC
jgi:predicted neuraminidase